MSEDIRRKMRELESRLNIICICTTTWMRRSWRIMSMIV